MSELTIDGRRIGEGHPCFIIAEIGVNHNGDVDTALRMIDAIADAGADCVKFQTFSAAEFVNGDDEIYEYISQGKVVRESQLAMFTRLEIGYSEFHRMFEHARKRGLVAFSTPTDGVALEVLEGLNVTAYKIGSDDLVYTPFLKEVGAKGRPVMISAGMADAEDVERALEAFRSVGNEDIAILHCVSLYPTPPEAVNLRKITALKERFPNHVIGFSDHSEGNVAAIGAVALGARIVEKHFTLDKNMPGPDHRFSMDPVELKALVEAIRSIEASLGSADLRPTEGELEMRKIARRSIVAARDLPVGHVIAEEDLAYQRPGTGMMPFETDRVVGRQVAKPIAARALIEPGSLHEREGGP